nr:hypothetical protein [Azospirillum brasilense]
MSVSVTGWASVRVTVLLVLSTATLLTVTVVPPTLTVKAPIAGGLAASSALS